MKLISIIFCTLLTLAGSQAATTNELPRFEELFKVIGTNLGGVSEKELDHAAVRGLLDQLQSKVILEAAVSNAVPEITKNELFEGTYEYLRLNNIQGNIAEKIAAAHKQNSETNKVKGVVLDLRFAGGTDYAAAGAVADLFLKAEQPLVDWGAGTVSSTVKEKAISVPVAILVNAKTSGSAEALAGILKEARVGLIIGSPTSGQASIFKEVTLSNGQKLRIATAQVKVGDGKVLAGAISPDIKTQASLDEETAYAANPYLKADSGSVTNLADDGLTNRVRRRINEAELVRQQREGSDVEDETSANPLRAEPGKPVITDPALARAIDLLKALAVVQQGASSFSR